MSTNHIIFYYFTCLFLSSLNGNCQIIDSKTIEKNEFKVITGSVDYLKSDSSISYQAITSGKYDNQFSKLENKPVIITGYGDDFYWFKFVIRNNDTLSKTLILLLGPTGMRDADLFQLHNTTLHSLGKTGHKYSFAKRPYQYMHYAYPITISGKSIDTFYLREDYYFDYKAYGFALIQPQAFKAYENKVYFFFGIIIGLLFLFLVSNLLVFFFLKERVHLWYALYIGILILVVMKNDQLDEQFLGSDSEVGYRLLNILSLGGLAIGVLLHVVQIYFKNIPVKSLIYRCTLLAKVNLIVGSFIQLIIFNFPVSIYKMSMIFNWVDYSTIVGVAFIIVNCFYSYLKDFKSALFILSGLFGFLIGAIQKLLLTSTNSILFPPSLFHFGLVIEIVIISFGFIYTYSKERKTNRAKESLFKDELYKAQLEILKQTLNEISREIHDNIGQTLTLAKITLNNLEFKESLFRSEKIKSCNALLNKALHDLYNLSKGVRVENLSNFELSNAIKNEILIINKACKFEINLNEEGDHHIINNEHQLMLFRIFQEVLTNAIKHSNGSKIDVKLYYSNQQFQMIISDNGDGFNVNKEGEPRELGLGIRNMKSRAKILGAGYRIQSKLGHGTAVAITLPAERI